VKFASCLRELSSLPPATHSNLLQAKVWSPSAVCHAPVRLFVLVQVYVAKRDNAKGIFKQYLDTHGGQLQVRCCCAARWCCTEPCPGGRRCPAPLLILLCCRLVLGHAGTICKPAPDRAWLDGRMFGCQVAPHVPAHQLSAAACHALPHLQADKEFLVGLRRAQAEARLADDEAVSASPAATSSCRH
jgi:hypothetical protein